MNRAVFFDRDGVLNDTVWRDGKACSPREATRFRLFPEAKEVILQVKSMGFMAIVVTNQPDISRGLMPSGELAQMHEILRQNLPVDAIRFCPHDDSDQCTCRKPLPGMLRQAAVDFCLHLPSCWMIGDSPKDIEAGRQAGCHTVLVKRPYNTNVQAESSVASLTELPSLIDRNSDGDKQPDMPNESP